MPSASVFVFKWEEVSRESYCCQGSSILPLLDLSLKVTRQVILHVIFKRLVVQQSRQRYHIICFKICTEKIRRLWLGTHTGCRVSQHEQNGLSPTVTRTTTTNNSSKSPRTSTEHSYKQSIILFL